MDRTSRRRRIVHLAMIAGVFTFLAIVVAPASDAQTQAKPADTYETFGTIERLDPRLEAIVPSDAKIEKLADGFRWAEGPVWIKDPGFLVFSDVEANTVYRWTPGTYGTERYLTPSGYTGPSKRGGEPGSNGLTLDPDGNLVLMQHGDRKVVRRVGDKFEPLAEKHEGKRLNSPNDGVYKSNGDFYFTDPPYGLERGVDDPARELDFQGVYRISKDGKLTLLTKELSRPNGIAFSPDEKTLYVANSDPERAIWMAYPVKDDGTLGQGKVFADVTKLVGKKKGLPDGLKVDQSGNVFATGPGGVLIFAPDGTHLGSIDTGEATANCGWGDDRSTLYITADMYLARIKLSTKGAGFAAPK
jgi:gluconolactonase